MTESYYKQAIAKSGRSLEEIRELRRKTFREIQSEPWRIVLSAKNGLHTIDQSSEWADLCCASWLFFRNLSAHRNFWKSIQKDLSTLQRGFEPGSGFDFIEKLAAHFVEHGDRPSSN